MVAICIYRLRLRTCQMVAISSIVAKKRSFDIESYVDVARYCPEYHAASKVGVDQAKPLCSKG
jgi:hypothetical protein